MDKLALPGGTLRVRACFQTVSTLFTGQKEKQKEKERERERKG
jgi:hypothetical protein